MPAALTSRRSALRSARKRQVGDDRIVIGRIDVPPMRGDRLLIERGEAAIKDPVDPLIGGAGEIVEGLGRPFRVRHRLARVLEVGRQQRVRLALRSEEHTSELQSLMRISYAVFCLKKK